MKKIVIISAVRTPVGRYMGALKNVEAYDLAASVINAAVDRVHLSPDQVDEVIMGQSYQNGEYVNIARMALLQAGWPDHIPGVTLDRRCCTGLEVVRYAASLIRSNQAEIVLAGGVESMSNAEFYLPGKIKWGIGGKGGMPKGHGDVSIWGLPFYDRIQRARVMSQPTARYGILPSMMSWAETAAEEEDISREACDQWSLESHRKAVFAASDGRFADEILPVKIPVKKGAEILFDTDETPRPDTSMERLAGLKPVLGGVCTAGNSSTESDGAAAVLVASAEKARELGIEPLVSIESSAVVGGDPRRAYQTVPLAVKKVLAALRMTLDQIGCIEIQEAFAAQVLADLKTMGLSGDDYGKINVNGSGISLGHPIACTGTRVLVTLLHEMKRGNIDYGLASICGGGGLGIATVLKRWL
jgi:acetyl-CoA C-acetyltransferase